jgi:nucleoside phosphorylase
MVGRECAGKVEALPMPREMTLGIVTAKAIEHAAIRHILDAPQDHQSLLDRKWYCIGTVPSVDPDTSHQVVVSQQTRDGTRDAAAAVTGLLLSFPSIRFILMCGIAAGGRSAEMHLGDIVSATEGIVDYGHLRVAGEGGVLRRPLGDVSAALLDADNRLAEAEIHGRRPWLTTLAALERDNVAFRRPPPAGMPAVHRGAIGSADVLLRDAALRDILTSRHRIIALEMEASGIAVAARHHGREYFVVRGVSDLADQDKDDRWQGYAAAGAAAYLRALLGGLLPEQSTSPPVRRGSTAAMAQIVEALLGSRLVRDEHDRQRLLDELPTHIRSAVPYSPASRTHVISIVRTCQDHPGGLDALLDSLSLLIGAESREFGALADVIRQNWNRG